MPVLRNLAAEYFEDVFADDGGRFLACPELSEGTHDDSPRLPSALRNELKSVETEIKYEGYLQQQQRAIERLKKSEQRSIPAVVRLSFGERTLREKCRKSCSRFVRAPWATHRAFRESRRPAVSLVNVYIEIQSRRRVQAATL